MASSAKGASGQLVAAAGGMHRYRSHTCGALRKSDVGKGVRLSGWVHRVRDHGGSIPRMIEGTQFGSIQAWAGPPQFLAGVDSRFEVLSAPGVFKSLEHNFNTMQDPELNSAFLALGANKGLKGVGLYTHGPAGFAMRSKAVKLALTLASIAVSAAAITSSGFAFGDGDLAMRHA